MITFHIALINKVSCAKVNDHEDLTRSYANRSDTDMCQSHTNILVLNSQTVTGNASSVVISKSREVWTGACKAGCQWYTQVAAAAVPLTTRRRLSFTTQHGQRRSYIGDKHHFIVCECDILRM